MDEFKPIIEELIETAHAPGKHAARNALYHIQKAWEIKDIDSTMAAFRAITGVEEAATAIFHALKRRKYNHAKLLNKDRHFHKAAVYPFLLAIGQMFAGLEIRTQLRYDKNDTNSTLQIALSFPTISHLRDQWFSPVPPLHTLILVNNHVHDFSRQIENIVSKGNAKNMLEYSKELAHMRNRLLYASSEGCPYVKSPIEPYIEFQERIVLLFLKVYLLIDPHKEQQLFVQQALNAFIKTLRIAERKKG